MCAHEMQGLARLVLEALIVGGSLAAALGGVAWAWPASLRTASSATLVGFALGVAFHLGFEALGLNAAYCTSGHACSA